MALLTPLLILLTSSSLPIPTSAQVQQTHSRPARLHRWQTDIPSNNTLSTTTTTTKTTTETLKRIAIWTTLPIAQQTADPLCFNAADPDAGIGNHCVCGTEGGDYTTLPNIQLPEATVTGTDGGLVVNASDYNPCGWTLVTVTDILGTGGVVIGTVAGGWNATVTGGSSLGGSGGVISITTSTCTSSATDGRNNVVILGGRQRLEG